MIQAIGFATAKHQRLLRPRREIAHRLVWHLQGFDHLTESR
jgi:hypothetical protein